MTGERESNFELLRVISIFFIVVHHCATFSFIIPENDPVSGSYVLMYCLNFGTRVGVSCFVLLSGWFLSAYNEVGKKTARLVVQVTAASVFTMLIAIIMGSRPGFRYVFQSCLPLIYSTYWFATTYALLLLLSGYINQLLDVISRERFLGLVALFVTLAYIFPTFLRAYIVSMNLFNFITLYLIAAYMRRYSPTLFESRKWLAWAAILFFGLMAVGVVMLFMKEKIPFLGRVANGLMQQNMLTTLACSVALFAGLKNCRMKQSKIVNFLGSASFGVYLLHATPHFDWWIIFLKIWDGLFPGTLNGYKSPMVLPYIVFSLILTFAVCILIDVIYKKTIDRFAKKLINKIWDKYISEAREKMLQRE